MRILPLRTLDTRGVLPTILLVHVQYESYLYIGLVVVGGGIRTPALRGSARASQTGEPSAAEASNARQKCKYLNLKSIEHANVCDLQTRGNQMRRAGPGLGVLKRTKNS